MKKGYGKRPRWKKAKTTAAARRRKLYAARDKRAAKARGLSVRVYKKRRAAYARKHRAMIERIPHEAMVEMLMGKRKMDPEFATYLRGTVL